MTVNPKLLLLTVLAILGTASPAAAQATSLPPLPGEDPALADRVAAVVGDSIILLSEVQREMALMAEQQDLELPTEPELFRQAMGEVLENLIDVQLILQEAARDTTLEPSNALIDQRADQHIAQVQSQVGGARQLQQALAAEGMSMTAYRDEIRSQIRRAQIRDLFMQRRLADASPVVVTDEELRELYDAQRAQLQARPEVLTFDQIIIRPSAPDSSWARARSLADSLLGEVRAGADFAALATEWSDDPGSAANGGDMGWFRRGVGFVREFEEAAFSIPPGQTSQPVRTQYGWHLIKVDRTRPGEVKARHILIRPEPAPDDMARAMELAGLIADSLRAGVEVSELNERYGAVPEGTRIQSARDQLAETFPPPFVQALGEATEGEVLEPFSAEMGPESLVVVIKVNEIREAGEFTFEDLRDTIRDRVSQQKRVDRILEELRERTYVDIRF